MVVRVLKLLVDYYYSYYSILFPFFLLSYFVVMSDLWSFDSSSWTKHTTTQLGGPRKDMVTWMPSDGTLCVFGGDATGIAIILTLINETIINNFVKEQIIV